MKLHLSRSMAASWQTVHYKVFMPCGVQARAAWTQPLILFVTFTTLLLLGGCASSVKTFPLQESFSSTQTYSRRFTASAAQTCEAARRALLSQGYIINTSRDEMVEGQKSFQPEADSNLLMSIRVVCAPETAGGGTAIGFVTALQDTYGLKKSNNSASLGVGAIGSVSLPFSSSNDSLVRVASETISSGQFYERFFELVARYLPEARPPG